MKKFFKAMFSGLLSCTLFLSTGANTYGNNEREFVVKDIKVAYSNTYIINEENELWKSTENNEFIKMYDNVESIIVAKYGGLLIVMDDGRLLYEEDFYDDETLESIVIEENVISAHISEGKFFILKDDNNLYEADYFMYDNNVENLDFQLLDEGISKLYGGDIGYLFYSDFNNNLFLYGNDEYSFFGNEKFDEPTLITGNVVDFSTNNNNAALLDVDGNVYYLGNSYILSNNELPEESDIFKKTFLIDDATEIEMSSEGLFVIKNDGSLWVKGNNYRGTLGIDFNVGNDFVKITDGVVDVASGENHTIFLKDDDSIWGMGNNDSGQLGYVEIEEKNYFDENGFRLITTDAKDISMGEVYTFVIREDDSLWKIGGIDIYTEENREPEFEKVADDVTFVGSSYQDVFYVKGSDKKLYATGLRYMNLYQQDDENVDAIISQALEQLGYENSADDIFTNFTKEDFVEFDQVFNELLYGDALVNGNFEVASNVEYYENDMYLNTDGDLYKIISMDEHKLIASNVLNFNQGNEQIYIIDKNNKLFYADLYETKTISGNVSYEELSQEQDEFEYDMSSGSSFYDQGTGERYTEITYYTELENYEFIEAGLEGIKDIGAQHSSLYILDTEGNLTKYENYYDGFTFTANTNYLSKSNDDKVVFVAGKEMLVTNIDENVLSMDASWQNVIYVKENGELWGSGFNDKNQLGIHDVEQYYIYEPIKIMDNVTKAVLGIYNESTILLTEDGEVYGMGMNQYGELGFEAQGWYYNTNVVLEPVELELNFVE